MRKRVTQPEQNSRAESLKQKIALQKPKQTWRKFKKRKPICKRSWMPISKRLLLCKKPQKRVRTRILQLLAVRLPRGRRPPSCSRKSMISAVSSTARKKKKLSSPKKFTRRKNVHHSRRKRKNGVKPAASSGKLSVPIAPVCTAPCWRPSTTRRQCDLCWHKSITFEQSSSLFCCVR